MRRNSKKSSPNDGEQKKQHIPSGETEPEESANAEIDEEFGLLLKKSKEHYERGEFRASYDTELQAAILLDQSPWNAAAVLNTMFRRLLKWGIQEMDQGR